MTEEAKIAEKIGKRNDETILKIMAGEKIINGHKKTKRCYFAATESSYIVLEGRKETHRYSWFDIRKIEQIGDDIIRLDFPDSGDKKPQFLEFTAEREQLDLMKHTILQHINTIMRESELPVINAEYSRVKVPEVEQRLGPLYRLRARVFVDRDISFEVSSAFRLWLLSDSDTLDMIEIDEDEEYTDDLLDCLHICQKLDHIIVSGSKSHWKAAAEFLSETGSVTKFTSRQDCDKNFSKFCKSLSEKCSSTLQELCFMRPVNIFHLAKVYSRVKLTGLTLRQDGNTENLGNNISQFINSLCRNSSNETYLQKFILHNFSMTVEVAAHIFRMVSSLKTVGFRETRFDMYMFHMSKYMKDCSVHELDMSGNLAIDSVENQKNRQDRFILSPKIRRFVCNNCMCNMRKMMRILSVVGISTHLKSISINHMGLSFDDTQTMFVRLQETPGYEHSLEEFSYDENYITPEFFCFLERFQHLRVLSVNGCASNASEVALLAEYISVNATIEKLCMNGTMKRRITSESMKRMIHAFTTNRTIRHVEIAHHDLKSTIVDSLGDMLMENRVLEYLDIHDCGISDITVFNGFLDRLQKRGAPLTIPLPVYDFEILKTDEALLKSVFQRLSRRRTGESVPSVKQEPLVRPSYRKINSTDSKILSTVEDNYPAMKFEQEDPSAWELECPTVEIESSNVDTTLISDEFSPENIIQEILKMDPLPGPEHFGSIYADT